MSKYRYSSIYIKDEEAYERAKEIARQMNVSLSELVNAFFRALAEQSDRIRIDIRSTTINIGALQIAIVQQDNRQVNINITQIKTSLLEAIELLKSATQTQHIQKKTAFERSALDILKKIVSKL